MSPQKSYKQYQLNAYPIGLPDSKTWKIVTKETPTLKEGEFLLQITHWSVDPYMRTRMSTTGLGFATYPLNESVPTLAVGTVIQSKNDKVKVKESYSGMLSLSEYHVVDAKGLVALTKTNEQVPKSYYLSVFGLTGGTAYQGNVLILDVKKGDTYFVNAAAGAVGSVAGVIAKALGAYVIGSAGGDEKCKLLTEKYGFDGSIDYKKYNTKESFSKVLKEKFPNGIDKYFDNVGGYQTDSVIPLLNKYGRVAVCGQISQYNATKAVNAGFNLGSLIYKSVRIEGFVFTDLVQNREDFSKFVKDMTVWVTGGKMIISETVFDGFESMPKAFNALLTGDKKGKVVIQAKQTTTEIKK